MLAAKGEEARARRGRSKGLRGRTSVGRPIHILHLWPRLLLQIVFRVVVVVIAVAATARPREQQLQRTQREISQARASARGTRQGARLSAACSGIRYQD